MPRISFNEVMAYYPGHNHWAYTELRKAMQNGSTVVPFVGAGLSIPFGCRPWPAVLNEATNQLVHDDTQKSSILEKIKNYDLIDAAEEIYRAYPPFLRRLPEILYASNLPEVQRPDLSTEKLLPSAAYILPMLFPSQPVITTNFDPVLESVYRRKGKEFIQTLEPQDLPRLSQVRTKGTHALVKLHGSIDGIVDIQKLIFTREQYDRAYSKGSLLVNELTHWFSNWNLLFLGCSLVKDNTLDVLQSLVKGGAQLTHFAILPCKPEDFTKRLVELGELGVIPIFYNSNNHDHTAVRVVLEQLLEDTNNEAYQLLAKESVAATPPPSQENKLLYDTEYIEFVGRGEELRKLSQFCYSGTTFAWWAVTGAGGMGKSRLVLEFSKLLQKQYWTCRWFRQEEYDLLQSLQVPTAPTLVILDEVQSNTNAVKQWITGIATLARSNKLRVILLERDGENYSDAPWIDSLRIGTPYNDSLRRWCYDEKFLRLNPLNEQDLKNIIENYGKKAGKPLQTDRLLEALRSVDPDLLRPLYAMAIAEAACDGEDPTNWDSHTILNALLDRELNFFYQSMRRILGSDPNPKQLKGLEHLLVQICVRGALPLSEAKEHTVPDWLDQCCKDTGMDPEDLFRGLGILRSRQTGNGQVWVLRMDCPDLVKEQLVIKLSVEGGRLEYLLTGAWMDDEHIWSYLTRLVENHTESMRIQEEFLAQLLEAKPTTSDGADNFAFFLFAVANTYADLATTSIDRLYQLQKCFPKEVFLQTAYAASLVNLTAKQDLAGCKETVGLLRDFYDQHSQNENVAVAYAKALVNLTVEQDLAGCKETVGLLRDFYDQHSQNEKVAVEYAKALVNLTVKQDLAGCKETVGLLRDFYDQHSQNENVAVEYAKALVNLTVKQDLAGCKETVGLLRDFYDQHSQNEKVAVEYAKALVNLTVEQDLAGREKTVGLLRELYDQHSQNEKVAVEYAKALVNLTVKQDLAGCKETVGLLRELYDQHSQNENVAVEYAKALFNLTVTQDLAGCKETVGLLRDFYDQHSQNENVAVEYAKALLVMSLDQAPKERLNTVNLIVDVLRDHKDTIPMFSTVLEKVMNDLPENSTQYEALLKLCRLPRD